MAADPTEGLNWWISRRAALYKAYTSPTLEVRFEGRLEIFKSQDDIARAINMCDQMILSLGGQPLPAVTTNTYGPVRTTRVDQYDY